MVANNAVNSFIIVLGRLRGESDNDTSWWFGFYNSYKLGESKNIALLGHKLEWNRKITLIMDVQKSIGSLLSLNFTEMDGSGWQMNIVTLSLTSKVELELVATHSFNSVVGTRDFIDDGRHVFNSDFVGLAWGNGAFGWTDGQRMISTIIMILLNHKTSRYLRWISQCNLSLLSLTNKEWTKVNAILIKHQKWVLADSTDF